VSGRRREMKTAEKATMRTLFSAAHAAGSKAAIEVVPEPMRIHGYAPISEGVCGFAWVTIRPGISPAARYAKATLGARKGYYGGMEIWVRGYGQSMTRKEAYAEAFAAVLREAGVMASAGSRLD
jgi:hypothetical protein